jgi:hypothetical protein
VTLGPSVDVLYVPGREATTVRVGLVVRVPINPRLEVRGTFVPTIHSPDSLGLVGSDFTELGLRWRWASN